MDPPAATRLDKTGSIRVAETNPLTKAMITESLRQHEDQPSSRRTSLGAAEILVQDAV
jgi:hypothetical protein